MVLNAIVLLVTGIFLLVWGAEALVRGAARCASKIGVSSLVIGLTVVSFGTSAPEMAVSTLSALAGKADIAVGNVVGSNILNILLILGLSATITPLVVSRQLIRLDVPIMIGVSILMCLLGLDGKISRGEGMLLFSGIVGYTIFSVSRSRKEGSSVTGDPPDAQGGDTGKSSRALYVHLGYIAAGLVFLVIGSNLLVRGATVIAKALGLSELVIGLTVVAAGTSLPEVATSVVASIRGEKDIAVGNAVGSNIFNILAALGLTGIVAPDGVAVSPAARAFDIPVMIAVAVACLPVFFRDHTISRREGILFLCYYVAYTAYLILQKTENATLHMFKTVMVMFVIPITVITLLVLTVRALKR